jgi:alkylation response protein AidB-like acyl-CoA dehydrogenase
MSEDTESVSQFRSRARDWIARNLPRRDPEAPGEMTMAQAKELQATIFDGGFAGVAVPRAYGGAGLTLEHQEAWAEEVRGFVVPEPVFVSIGMLGITLLDHGSEVLKQRHLPRILRGDEVWLQLLSEPSGGSDMAAAMTRATRDGDSWIINGAKTWTTGAGDADYGMCLARTNWEAPKHRGLSMFAVPLSDPRVTIEPIVGCAGGPAHFFQEFLDDVSVPAENLLGDENDGWRVAHTLLFHERNATAGVGHGLGLGGGGERSNAQDSGIADLARYAQQAGSTGDPAVRQLIAQAYIDEVVRGHANDRVAAGMRLGVFEGDWGSLLKLGLAVDMLRRGEIALAAAGAPGVIWTDGEPEGGGAGQSWMTARNISIAGGTNEIQRNIVSERLLNMPREPASDRDVPFIEVVRRRGDRHGPP